MLRRGSGGLDQVLRSHRWKGRFGGGDWFLDDGGRGGGFGGDGEVVVVDLDVLFEFAVFVPFFDFY